MALRRRLAGVTSVDISQERQHARVTLSPMDRAFAPAEFRAAVAEADVEVVTFEVVACGHVDPGSDGSVFVAGANRFIIPNGSVKEEDAVCLSGNLRDETEPPRLESVRLTVDQ